jgi:DNA (cytosine-5)-methyltransferase 1
MGYHVEWRLLIAADFGAPTSRTRLFLMARCDGEPIVWPNPTHGPGRERPYRTAAEIIDWSIPCPSIFARKKPYSDKSCARIARGCVRFVSKSRAPHWVPVQPGPGGKENQVAAFIAKHYSGVTGHVFDRPIGTVTCIDHHALVYCTTTPAGPQGEIPPGADRVAAFIVKFYSCGGQWQSIGDPLHTVTCKARMGLVTVTVNGQTRYITDIGMRMLAPHELAAAQGFPDTYSVTGTKTERIARIGNSVCPPVAKAIVEANLTPRSELRAA